MSKFRYFITHQAVTTRIYSKGQIRFTYERDDNQIFYNLTFDSGLNVGGQDQNLKDSYEVLKAIEDGPDRCEDVELLVEVRCGNKWNAFFNGIFAMNDASFDEDKCIIEVAVDQNDLLRCLSDNDKDVNILAGTTPVNASYTTSNIYEFLACPDLCTTTPLCNGEFLNVDGWKLALSKCTDIIPGTGILRTALDESGLNINPYSKIDGNFMCYYHGAADEFQVYDFDLDTTTTILATTQDVRPFAISGDFIGLYSRQFDTVYIYKISTDTLTVVEASIASNLGDDDLAVGGDFLVYHNGSDIISYEISTGTPTVIESTTNVSQVSCDGIHALYEQEQGVNEVQLYDIGAASLITLASATNFDNVILSGNNVYYENTQGTNELFHYNITTAFTTSIISNATFDNIEAEGTTIKFDDSPDVFIWTEGTGIINVSNVGGIDIVVNSYFKCGRVYYQRDNASQTFHHLYVVATLANTIFRQDLIALEPFDLVELMNDSIVFELFGQLLEFEFLTTTEIVVIASAAIVTMSSDCTSIGFYNTNTNDVHYYRGRIGNAAKITIYYREKVVIPCSGLVPNPPAGTGWILFDDDCAGSGVATWVRVPLLSITIVEDLCPGGIPTTPPGPEVFHFIVCDEGVSFWYSLGEPFIYDRFRKLEEVMLRIITEICPDVTGVVSDLFQWTPENPSAIDYVTELATKIDQLLIAQKSDFKDPLSSEEATKGNIRFDELTDYLKDMFQAFWFIEDGKFRIEHISFFLTTVGLDLTLPAFADALDNQNRYTYDATLQRRDTFTWMESQNVDFVGFPIEYNKLDGTKSKCVGDSDEEHDVGRITTDLDFINTLIATGDADDIDDDGFVIVAATQQSPTDYTIIQDVGAITGITYNNATLSFANLHRDYWPFNRPTEDGFLNGIFQAFKTTKRIKLQDAFNVKNFCCDDILAFDPTKLVTANYGDSEVEKAEWNGQTDVLTLELRAQ